jgi:solute carrier family 25 folate transporter 32
MTSTSTTASSSSEQTTPSSPSSTTTVPPKRLANIRHQPTGGSRILAVKDEPHTRGVDHLMSTFAAGVGSGALASVICAPLDLIRTRMQVWSDVDRGAGNSPKQAFQEILKKEGWRGCFRGLGATLVTVPLFWGVYFPLYDETKYWVTQHYPDQNVSVIHCGSAVFTGAIADLICNPLFVIRTRLQTQALHQLADHQGLQASGMRQTAKELFTQHGLPVFWRGMTANMIGLTHVAVQFPAYEYLKKMARERRGDGQPETPLELLLASGASKVCASLLTYPHEVIRSRMMDSRASTAPTLRGTILQIWTREGMAGFYTALPVTLIRVIPNCCITFLSYELFFRWTRDELKDIRGAQKGK